MGAAKKLALDYNPIRIALVREVRKVTGLECILEEGTTQNYPRPPLPYFSFKITTPGARYGDDSSQYDSTGTIFSSGGQRKMSVSFHCYTKEHEDAYNFMTLWQTSLDLRTVQEDLRRTGIAVWIIGTVADLSQLLNTGYEARAQMDVQFGVAANLTEDLGEIDSAQIHGDIDTDQGIKTIDFTVPS